VSLAVPCWAWLSLCRLCLQNWTASTCSQPGSQKNSPCCCCFFFNIYYFTGPENPLMLETVVNLSLRIFSFYLNWMAAKLCIFFCWTERAAYDLVTFPKQVQFGRITDEISCELANVAFHFWLMERSLNSFATPHPKDYQ